MSAYEGNQKWRAAYPGIEVSDNGLSPFKGRFPSLEINDFVVYLESRGSDKDVCDFVRHLALELNFAYDNWAKAQRDNNAGKLIGDMLNGTFGDEAAKRYIIDYAKANNLQAVLPSDKPKTPWVVETVGGEQRLVQGSEQITQ